MRFLASLPTALLLWLLCAAPAWADAPAGRNIAVFGDSLGDGVWSGLYVVVKRHPGDQLFRHAKVGAGLTRPDYDSWLTELTQALDQEKITTAVVMFGTNDQKSIRDENQKGYLYQSDGWKRTYIQRIDAVLAELAKRKIQLVWVGLPIMRRDDLNAGAAYLDEIYAGEVRQAGGTFLDLADAYKGPDGAFAPYLPDASGHLRQVRTEDGVHFTPTGYEELAEKVYAAIEGAPAEPAPPATH